MKYMIISDIHGSSKYLKMALDIFDEIKANKLIILGDYLYHGPRNALPEGYDTMECVNLLNSIKDKIIAIRGNCDADIDEELLDFKMENNRIFEINNKKYLFTHGHKINETTDTDIDCDYVVIGHFHIQKMYLKNGKIFYSPGSISMPRNNSYHGYAIINENGYQNYDLLTKKPI